MAFSITDIILLCIMVLFLIIGIAKGIIGKILGWLNIFIALVIAYYIATPLSTLFFNTPLYTNMYNAIGEKWTNFVILIISGIIIFIVLFIVLNILKRIISRGINNNKIIGFFNRTLGGILGLVSGLFIGTLYLLIFYGLAKVDPNINAFYVQDLSITNDKFTFSKFLMNYLMQLF